MFVSIDGPRGAGKSTIVRHLAQMLVAASENVHITAEPSFIRDKLVSFFASAETGES